MDTDLARRLEGQAPTDDTNMVGDGKVSVVEQSDPAPEDSTKAEEQAESPIAWPDPSEVVVFAFRLTRAERDALKLRAAADGWLRAQGGVTGWARASLVALATSVGGPLVDPPVTGWLGWGQHRGEEGA